MKTVMAALAAVLVSGFATAETDAQLDKNLAQLNADHDQLTKIDGKGANSKSVAQSMDQRSPERFTAAAQSGQPSQGPGKPADKGQSFDKGLKETSVGKGPHDAAKADANTADATGSMGTGNSSGRNPKEIKGHPHDVAKSDANTADSTASIGTGDSSGGHDTDRIKKAPHDAAKSDANMADSSASMGSGASSAPTSRSERVIGGGGMRNDGRSEAVRHEGVHGGGVSDGHFGGGAGGHSGGHGGGSNACHHGLQGC